MTTNEYIVHGRFDHHIHLPPPRCSGCWLAGRVASHPPAQIISAYSCAIEAADTTTGAVTVVSAVAVIIALVLSSTLAFGLNLISLIAGDNPIW